MDETHKQAPWSDLDVGRLVAWQLSPLVHGFTCGRRSGHAWRMGDFGGLTPTRDGWICEEPDCDYTQDWAYGMMFDPLPENPFAVLREDTDDRF